MLLNRNRRGPQFYVLAAITAVVMVYILVPLIFLIVLSFNSSRWLAFPPPGWTTRWFEELFTNPSWLASIVNSVKVGVAVMLLSLLLGVPTSFALVRGKFPGKTALNAFFTSPLIVPVIIIAVALYGLALTFGLAGTFIAFIVAHLIVALPFAIICISSSLMSFDESLEKAAMICGASRIGAIWRITLPSIRPGIVAGGLFAFLISWDEVVLAIFMATPSLQTLPVKIWVTLRADLSPVIAAASSLLIVATMAIVLLVLALRRPQTER
jgi:putative spermidine/putrescine transport system permease protein